MFGGWAEAFRVPALVTMLLLFREGGDEKEEKELKPANHANYFFLIHFRVIRRQFCFSLSPFRPFVDSRTPGLRASVWALDGPWELE